MNDRDRPRHGCLRWLAWGCGCLVVAALLAAAAAYLGKDLLRQTDWYQAFEGAAEHARDDLKAAVVIAEELRQRYPAEDVNLVSHTSFGTDPGKVLTVRIINPEFSLADGPEGEPMAREIARYVATRFPSVSDMRSVVIEVHHRSATFSSQQRYEFAVDDLLAENGMPSTPTE